MAIEFASEAAGSRADLDLVERLVELRGVVNAADAECAHIVAELERRGDGTVWDCRSTAQFLMWQAGLSRPAANAMIDVARKLDELPALAAATAAGEVSVWEARAVASVARDDDDCASWLNIARHGTVGQLEHAARITNRLRHPKEPSSDKGTFVKTSWTVHGRMRLTAELSPDDGSALATALDSERHIHGTEELADDPELRRARALGSIARHFLDSSEAPTDGAGSAEASRLVVHVDERTLRGTADDCDADDAICRLGLRGVGLSPDVARRFGCDSLVQLLVRDGDGNPLAMGRTHRVVNRRLRRALTNRDGHCQYPGCDHTHDLHAHHIVHWVDGGRTDLDNLIMLCHFHHRRLHDGGCQVAGPAPQVEWTTSDGLPIETRQRQPRCRNGDPTVAARNAGLDPPADAAKPHWTGESIDWACFSLQI